MGFISTFTMFTVAATSLLLYGVGLVVYRLFFHPLSKFPGPKLAAITGWYEFYYDIAKDGQFFWKIEEMHKTYGRYVSSTKESKFSEISKI